MYLTGGFSQLTQGFTRVRNCAADDIIVLYRDIPMVQFLLAGARGRSLRLALKIASAVLLLMTPVLASRQAKVADAGPPDLLLDGGRKLSYERSFSSEREVRAEARILEKVG